MELSCEVQGSVSNDFGLVIPACISASWKVHKIILLSTYPQLGTGLPAYNLWPQPSTKLAHSADRCRSISLRFANIFSTLSYASSIQAISSCCGWGSAVWFLPIVRIPEFFSWRFDRTPSTSRSFQWQSTPYKKDTCLSSEFQTMGWVGTKIVIQTKCFYSMLMRFWTQNSSCDVGLCRYRGHRVSLEMDLPWNFLHCEFPQYWFISGTWINFGRAYSQVCGKSTLLDVYD